MKHDEIAVGIVSLVFLVYTFFAAFNVFPSLVFLIFSISPLLIIWMVWVVLRHGEYNHPELEEDQEFGYLDKPNLGKSTLIDTAEN
jgi:4-hydroxybenzoate polyprenyltransferase